MVRKIEKNATFLRDRGNCGFTLVELLVVMAIIGMLVALLMPALSKARATAMNLKCLANIKQIGVSSTMYAGDHNDYYMGQHWRAVNSSYPASLIPKHYASSKKAFRPSYPGKGNDAVMPLDSLAYNHYATLPRRGAWHCPRISNARNAPYHYAATTLHGHATSGHRDNYRGPYRGMEIKTPNRTWLVMDSAVIDGVPSSMAGGGNNRVPGNQQTNAGAMKYGRLTHDSGANIVFWDGHARLFDYTTWYHANTTTANLRINTWSPQSADGKRQQYGSDASKYPDVEPWGY